MNTTERNDTEIFEMMQTLMNEGLQGFPAVMARMYNLAMQFERELHLGAGKYERTQDRRGYANGYKPKTLSTHAGKLALRIPQVRDSETPFYPRSLERGTRYERALKMAVAEMYVKGVSTRKVQAVFDRLCDVIIAVTAPEKTRLDRIMQRDGIGESAARLRMSAQHGEDFFRSRADFVINGGMPRRDVRAAAAEIYKRVIKKDQATGG